MLTKLEKKIISLIQGDIPVVEHPYKVLAEKLGITEEALIKSLKSLSKQGVIRRFGATLYHQKSGYTANAMGAWKIDEDRIDEVGKLFASYGEISHCYRRNPTQSWPYNLYTMIHAHDKESCIKFAKNLAERVSVKSYKLLFSKKELKKVSMKYFINNA